MTKTLIFLYAILLSSSVWSNNKNSQYFDKISAKFLNISTLHFFPYDNRVIFSKKLTKREAKEISVNKITSHSKGYFINRKLKGDYYSTFFYNFSRKDLNLYLKSNKISKLILNSFISPAYSNSCGIPTLGSLSIINTQIANSFINSRSVKCLGSLLDGIWQSTGQRVVDIKDGLILFAESPEKFWNGVVTKFEKLKNLALNLKTKISKAFKSFSSLPAELQSTILCSFIGSIGTDALITFFTLGTGSAQLMLKLTSFSNNLKKITHFSKILKTKKILNKKQTKIFFDKLAKGKISQTRLKTLDSFSEYNMPILAKRAALCAI